MNPEPPQEGVTWRSLLWGTLSCALALTLVAKAVDAHGRNAVLHRRLVDTERELERIQRDENRMRAELRALQEDPLYLQSMIERTPAGTGEPVIERTQQQPTR
jgi:hypothetical protein